MTEELRESRGALARVVALTLRRRGWSVVQAGALLLAGVFAYLGARVLNENPQALQVNYEQGVAWLGLALLATAVVAWQPAVPKVRPGAWVPALAGFWRAHRVELLLFILIIGFGIFMRVYRFGGTLPPANGLCCEEHINGGVAYRALLGDWPLLYPLVRWGSAAGFLLFGETTLGLRFFFVVTGIATLPIFYLLLRQLVSVPAALFGLALYAAAWWPSLFNRQTSEGTIYVVLFALLLVRGLKTGSALMCFGAGILAALLSYEYDAFRVIPMIGAGFVGAAAVWEVLLRPPLFLKAAPQRALALLRVAWRPAVVSLMAAGIVLVPLIIGTRNGYDLYLTSVHRQQADRGNARFFDDWQRQAKWEAELFLPFGPKEYQSQPPMDVSGTPLLDPLAAWLVVGGLATSLVLFFRPFRLLFAGWLLLSFAAAALLLQNFSPWKFFGLVPVCLVLATLLVDDVRSAVVGVFGRWGERTLVALLAVGVAFSFWWNADTLFNDVAQRPEIRIAYANERSQFYNFCRYLRERGPDNHAFAFSAAIPGLGFARPRDTLEQQLVAWGDLIWVCHDLKGTALPAAEEAWPLPSAPAGPTTLVFASPITPEEQLIAELNRAYPGLGQPDRRIVGPEDAYVILGYEFSSGAELDRRGLWADYLPAGGETPTLSRVEPAGNLSWEETAPPLAPPFTVRWRGVVYVDGAGRLSLQAVTGEPVEVRLDGQVIYSTREGEEQALFLDLLPGWHPVEVTLDKRRDGGSLRLRWVGADGTRRQVPPDDLFPLAQLNGWTRQQGLGIPGQPASRTIQRLDFAPHYVSNHVAKWAAQSPEGWIVVEERWRAVWELDQPGTYLMRVQLLAGDVSLLVNGVPVVSEATGEIEVEVTLAAGRHALELVQQLDTDAVWSGATISVQRVEPSAEVETPPVLVSVPLRVMPY